MRTKAPASSRSRCERSRISHGERSRRAPTSGAAGVGRAPGARSEASAPGRVEPCHGGATQKRLQVVLDEKSPTYAPPTFVRVTPAELVAVGDE